jgi:hypothetical protein
MLLYGTQRKANKATIERENLIASLLSMSAILPAHQHMLILAQAVLQVLATILRMGRL